MITQKYIKKPDFVFQNWRQTLILLILFCFGAGYAGFYNFQTPAPVDLVYCPLQKIWVKKAAPQSSLRLQPLDEICAADWRKNNLQLELSLKNARALTENLVFDYLEKGSKVFAELAQPANSPPPQLLKQNVSETATSNYSPDFGKAEFAKFSLPQQPRPPTFSEKLSVQFDFQFSHSLEEISRHINPRSPPFFA